MSNRIIRYVTDADYRFKANAAHGLYHRMPDDEYLKRLYNIHMGAELNLENPITFNEKLQWLKIHDRDPLYTTLVDKYAVKEWVANRIGKQYVVPTLGVWDSFDEIDFDSLPERFVLKCTHDSGGLAICRDKSSFDINSARNKIERSLNRNYYWLFREWPYKDVPPRIIAEEYLDSTDGANNLTDGEQNGIVDYKLYCFKGEPRFLYVSQGLEDHATARISFLTLDWEFAPFGRTDYAPFNLLPLRPTCLEMMLELARKLSAGIPFVRVDLYVHGGQPLFGEMTFSPCAGLMRFDPLEWDVRLGEMLELPGS